MQVLRIATRDGIPSDDVTEVYANDGRVIKVVTGAMRYKNYMLAGSLYDKTLLCEITHV